MNELINELLMNELMNELIISAQDPSARRNFVPTPTDTLAGIKSII
jgi:hypothetical protein